jgi:hypothetical protein
MNDVVCECCGSGDTTSSLEKIGDYKELVFVIHCYSCKIYLYEEPNE